VDSGGAANASPGGERFLVFLKKNKYCHCEQWCECAPDEKLFFIEKRTKNFNASDVR
jgi:hypothetical protein